ncbi:hypothetical protein D3C78_1289370 [compost metagenome]
MFCSNTGSIALRLADVQPPNTAATLFCCSNLPAFSANVGQSEAPSSRIGSICLPRTPPAALISSMASISASFTDTSLIAIVPLNEWSMPTLIVSPDASVAAGLLVPLFVVVAAGSFSERQPDNRTIHAKDITHPLVMIDFNLILSTPFSISEHYRVMFFSSFVCRLCSLFHIIGVDQF